MNSVEIASRLSEFSHKINADVREIIEEFANQFEGASTDNNLNAKEFNLNRAMAHHLIVSTLNSSYKKQFDQSKKDLDKFCEQLDIDPSGIPNETCSLYAGTLFTFSKRQNANGEMCSVKDVVTELNKLGVDPEIIGQAVNEATKPKRGNTYYNVEVKG